MQHTNCLTMTPIAKTVSSGLPRSGAEILGILGFAFVGHSTGSTAEYGHAASFWNSESRLVPSAGEPGIIYTASASLALCIARILETRRCDGASSDRHSASAPALAQSKSPCMPCRNEGGDFL